MQWTDKRTIRQPFQALQILLANSKNKQHNWRNIQRNAEFPKRKLINKSNLIIFFFF